MYFATLPYKGVPYQNCYQSQACAFLNAAVVAAAEISPSDRQSSSRYTPAVSMFLLWPTSMGFDWLSVRTLDSTLTKVCAARKVNFSARAPFGFLIDSRRRSEPACLLTGSETAGYCSSVNYAP